MGEWWQLNFGSHGNYNNTIKQIFKSNCINNRRRQWHPTPVLLPGKSHGWRNLVAAVHGVTKSWTRPSDFTFTFHFHALEKEMATHSSVLAWRIPGTGEPGGLPSMGSHRVGHDWSDLAAAAAMRVKEESVKSWLKTQFKNRRSWHLSHHFMTNRRGKSENSGRFYFLGLQNHCGPWLQP